MLSIKSTISQKLKIAKLSNLVQNLFQNIASFGTKKNSDESTNFERPYSIQNISQLFGPKEKIAVFELGRVGVSLTRNDPPFSS